MRPLRKVLLVEDSREDAELTLAAFRENQLANEVVVVRDGQQALDYLFCTGAYQGRSDGPPAVVLLDLKLPKIDGSQVLQRVKEDSALRATPVVMLTSSREERDMVKTYGLGANAYVVKPVTLNEFMTALRELGLFWAVINEPPPLA